MQADKGIEWLVGCSYVEAGRTFNDRNRALGQVLAKVHGSGGLQLSANSSTVLSANSNLPLLVDR